MNLRIGDICFSYESRAVLESVSFGAEKGQVLAILGVNGAGKSTLLKCLNRILTPSGGSVLLDGEELLAMPRKEIARRVGYVPQHHGACQGSVYDAVLLGRKPHMGLTVTAEDHQVVEQTLARMGLGDLALRAVEDLSGGERQKVMIARALAQSPQILLMDEPTSNLDLKNQMEVMAVVRQIVQEQGLMAVVAIHDLNLAVRFADRFVFLKQQRIHDVVGAGQLSADIIQQVYGLPVAMAQINGHAVVVPL